MTEPPLDDRLLDGWGREMLRLLRDKYKRQDEPEPKIMEVDRPVVIPGEPAEVTIRRMELDYQRRERAEQALEAKKERLEKLRQMEFEHKIRLEQDRQHDEFMLFVMKSPSIEEFINFKKSRESKKMNFEES